MIDALDSFIPGAYPEEARFLIEVLNERDASGWHRQTREVPCSRLIYALCGQANAFCREAPQKCAPTFIDGRNIENKMYWPGLSGDGLTIRWPKE